MTATNRSMSAALGVALITLSLAAQTTRPTSDPPAGPKPVTFASKDGLTVTADLYDAGDKSKPLVLLCHQARSSRGEYRSIAPRLVQAGFSCLALDQRSGQAMNGVDNETAARAAKKGERPGYTEARQDIEAAIAWVRKQGYRGKLTLWGSSYSSSLALMIGAESKELTAVLSFAPGEYLRPAGSVGRAARKLKLPVLIVSPERERKQATEIFEVIPGKAKKLEIGPDIVHGSKTLFRSKDPEPTWKVVLAFLAAHGR